MPRHEPIERLHRDLGRLGEEVSRLRAQMQRVQQRTDQLFALKGAEPQAAQRLEQLEAVLDFETVAAHLQTAVARGSLTLDPIPHMSVQDLLPGPVYRAVLDALPPPVFFEGADDRMQDLRVPPRTGSLPSVVAWAFITEVVLRALGPSLLVRFESPLAAFARTTFPSLPPFSQWSVAIALSQARIVRRQPGAPETSPPDRPWDLLTCVVALGRPHESEDYGALLDTKALPFRGNTAVVFLGPAQAYRYLAIPSSAPPEIERYTYEFGIGPTRDARRALIAKMSQHDAATWSTRG